MEKIVLAILVFIFFVSNAHSSYNLEWHTDDTTLQLSVTSLLIIDMSQTLTISNNPDKHYEKNPILGRHPSNSRVYTYFALSAISLTAISYILPKPYRNIFQMLSIFCEAYWVSHNYNLGIKTSF